MSRARARFIESRMHTSNKSENSTGPSGLPCLVPLVVGNCYNRGTKKLQGLQTGDTAHIVPIESIGNWKAWQKAEVERQMNIRLYEVRTEDGRVFHINRRKWWWVEARRWRISESHQILWKRQNHRLLHKPNCQRKCPRTFLPKENSGTCPVTPKKEPHVHIQPLVAPVVE